MSSQPLEFEPSRRDVVFGRGGDTELLLDVYEPSSSTTKRAAIIHLHDGGFRGGSKDAMAGKVQAYLRRGYVCIAPQYRLSGVAKWPSQIEDVKCAIRWVRANAGTLGIDSSHIAVAGYSAGGHLAMMAAGTQGQAELEGNGGIAEASSDIAACFAYYPPHIIRRGSDGSAHTLLKDDSTEADHAAASPLHCISPRSAPTVLFHDTADVTILPEASRLLYDAMVEAGVAAELHTFHGVPHEFDRNEEFSEQCADIADRFFEQLVLHPRTYPPFAPRVALPPH